MKAKVIAIVVALIMAAAFAGSNCLAQTVIDSDFSKGDFSTLGWKAKGDWDVFLYPKEAANNPGPVGPFRGQQARRLADQNLCRDQESREADALAGLRLGLGRSPARAPTRSRSCSWIRGQRLSSSRSIACKATMGRAVGQVSPTVRLANEQDLGVRGNRRRPRVGSRRRRLEPTDDHPRIRRSLDRHQQGLEQRRRRDGAVHRRHDDLVQPAGAAGNPELR